ncbi:MAG: NAD(P)-dependent oxidoreductase [Ignavibacteriales bacterium]|nr:MAG: NAD(P)-dependent oxidoreductase [Ignavibacteriales bacterium]
MEKQFTAVVTGASGFVGSHLVDLLLQKNYKVKCIVRKTSNIKWLKDKDIEIHTSELTDKENLRRIFIGADYIFHVAGIVKSKKPEGYFKGNVETTRALLEVALEYKDNIKRFLVVSSQTSSGPSVLSKPICEDDPCEPITTYGRSKLAQEQLAKSFMDRLPITICKVAAVYGERDTEIFIFFKTFAKGLMTSIGLHDKQVSLLHVADVVRGLYLAAVSENSAGKSYFITSEKFYTWKEVGDVTSKVMSKKPLKVKVPHFIVYTIAAIAQFFSMFSSKAATLNIEKGKDITRSAWISDYRKAYNDFNFKQEVSLEEGIKRTIEWYKQMKWL